MKQQQQQPEPVRIVNPMAAFIAGMKQQQNLDPALVRIFSPEPTTKTTKKEHK
jgi:hypothetical protein